MLQDTLVELPLLSTRAYGSELDEDRFRPLLVIHETPEAYDIEGDLPNAARSDVAVHPHLRYVEIACGHALDHDEDDTRHDYGSFSTRVDLGIAIDPKRARTTLKNGVLHIHAPKR